MSFCNLWVAVRHQQASFFLFSAKRQKLSLNDVSSMSVKLSSACLSPLCLSPTPRLYSAVLSTLPLQNRTFVTTYTHHWHERIVVTFPRAASWLLGNWNKSYYPDFPAYQSPLQLIQSFDISRSKPSLVFACLEGFTNSTFKVAGLKEWPCCYIFKNNTIKFYIIR